MDCLRCPDDVAELTEALGFLPFFANGIPGFSVEEHTPRELWFTEADGPWEWKGPIARTKRCLYGKFFGGKAGFISLEWFPDFANYRRDGFDFDSRYESGLASRKDMNVYDTVSRYGTVLSKKLKSLCGYSKGGEKGFDGVITRLQMQTYICVADFEYMRDKYGKQYGWGVARYSTPEELLGYEAVTSAYSREPAESLERILDHLKNVLPEADGARLLKMIK